MTFFKSLFFISLYSILLIFLYNPSIVAQELTEGNAVEWTTYASDGASASTTDNTNFVQAGNYSVAFNTASGFSTGLSYTSNWSLTNHVLHFSYYGENPSPSNFQTATIVRLYTSPIDYFEYVDNKNTPAELWENNTIDLTGSTFENWSLVINGNPDLSSINKLEFEFDTWDTGFTLYLDDVRFEDAQIIQVPDCQQQDDHRGFPHDLWADVVLGQPNFKEVVPNKVTASSLFNPGGTAIDASSGRQILYVWDSSNSRIVAYDLSIPACGTSMSGCAAIFAIGQEGLIDTEGANRDGGYESYPNRAISGRQTLAGVPEDQLSVAEFKSFAGMYVDSEGNLYVNDFFNHRILKYNDPVDTDNLADEVWGQANFTSNGSNGSGRPHNSWTGTASIPPQPTSSSFCFLSINGIGAGVEIDDNGNMWVADGGNHRVLRFPYDSNTQKISSSADIVFGMPDMNTGGDFSEGLSSLNSPHAVTLINNRIFIPQQYKTELIYYELISGDGSQQSDYSSQIQLIDLATIDAEATGIQYVFKDPANDNLWIIYYGVYESRKIVLVDTNGTVIIGPSNFTGRGGGSIAMSSTGDIYVAEQRPSNVKIFSQQSIGQAYIYDHSLIEQDAVFNQSDAAEFDETVLAVDVHESSDQIVINEGGGVYFWDQMSNLSCSRAPDGVLLNEFNQPVNGVTRLTVGGDKLWLALQDASKILVYDFPLIDQLVPSKVIALNDMPLLGGGVYEEDNNSVTFPGNYDHDPNNPDKTTGTISSDVEYDPFLDALWVSSPIRSRVFRIRNVLGNNPIIDVVLGQFCASDDFSCCNCNRGFPLNQAVGNQPTAPLDKLCVPGSVTVDKNGQVWVSDHWLEVQGNFRLLRFNKTSIPDNPTSCVFAPDAIQSFENSLTFKVAFDSENHMVSGVNAYRSGRHFRINLDPYNVTDYELVPDTILSDFSSMGYYAVFDEADNLYVADLNRGRVLKYKQPMIACQATLIESASTIIETNQHVDQSISTQGLVPADQDVIYSAGECINLFPGFEVLNDAVFHAIIRECGW